MARFAAVLWDCDGCLIDSEWIACGLGAQMLTELGYPISTQEFVLRFCGQSKQHIYGTIQRETGIDYLPLLAAQDKKQRQRDAFKKDLHVICGIEAVLDGFDAANIPQVIASGSAMDRLEYTLQVTGLYDRFAGKIFNADMVERGKPHPDVFLYAAAKIGIAPEQCLVIEDSHNGVRAGKAAGMTVFGFTGGKHILNKEKHAAELRELGADVIFHEMLELPSLVL